MKANTKYFGEVEIEDDKILEFPNGIIGFESLRKFAIIYDVEKGENVNVSFLQSMEEPLLVIPVMNPLVVKEDYNPTVDDELLKPIGDPSDEDMMVVVSMTVPADIKKMTVNLKAPFIINTKDRKGAQIIVDNPEYEIRFPIYDILEANKQKAGE